MAKPTLESFAQDLYDRIQPLTFADPTYDWPIAKLVNAFGEMFQLVEDYGRDDPVTGAPGWSVMLDINKCPPEAIPWLGQFVGVRLPSGLTTDQQRAYVKDAPGWDRGTVAAIVASAQPFLTGQKSVTIRERFDQANPNVDSPGYYQVTTRGVETPAEDLPSTNLAPNGGIETNTTGWTATGGPTRSTTKAKFGSASLRFTTAGGVNDSAQCFITTGFVTGDVLTFSCYINPDVNMLMNIQINQNNNVPTLLDFSEGPAVLCPANVWTRLTFTRAIVAGATNVYFYITTYNVQPITNVYVDGVQIEKNPQATPYIETNGAIASRPAGQGLVGDALAKSKPAGLIMNYQVLVGNTYQTIYDNNNTYATLYAKYTTYQRLLDDQPG